MKGARAAVRGAKDIWEMLTTYSNDEPVGVADQEQRNVVDKDGVEDQICSWIPIAFQVVNTARCQIALGHIPNNINIFFF